jgi:diguanylate cyclase (GGDEF)-like protein
VTLFDPSWYWLSVTVKLSLCVCLLGCGYVFVASQSSISGLRSRPLLEGLNAELERVNARLQESLTDAQEVRKELAIANRQLQSQAVTDALTDVANRRGFDARLAEALADCRRSGGMASLLMIDIDNFKKYNDTFGHPQGDECLRTIALAIRASVNRPRDFVARFGGEEFAVIMEGTDSAGARFLAERICAAIAQLDLPQGEGALLPFVSASIGVATAASAIDLVPDLLLFRADQALYAAKRAGGNAIVVADERIVVD